MRGEGVCPVYAACIPHPHRIFSTLRPVLVTHYLHYRFGLYHMTFNVFFPFPVLHEGIMGFRLFTCAVGLNNANNVFHCCVRYLAGSQIVEKMNAFRCSPFYIIEHAANAHEVWKTPKQTLSLRALCLLPSNSFLSVLKTKFRDAVHLV